MFRFSFTARLTLAMMFTVTIVTAGALWRMRLRVESAYLRLFEERFLSQIESFTAMQTVRLESLRERCRELAESKTVVEALKTGGELPDGLLRELQARARVVRASAAAFDDRSPQTQSPRPPVRGEEEGGRSETAGGPDARPPLPVSFEPVLNRGERSERDGRVRRRGWRLGPPDFVDLALVGLDGRAYSLKSGAAPERDPNLRWLRDNRVIQAPEEQQTGFLPAPPLPPDAPEFFRLPREVILTPVRDPETEALLGTLVVGLPLSTYGESVIYDLHRPGKTGEIHTGLWQEGQLFTRPESREVLDTDAVKETVLRAVSAAGAADGSESARVVLGGEPHQMLLRRLNSSSALPEAWQVTLYSLAGMTAEQRALRNEILGTAALALGAALALSYGLSRGLVHPVRELVEGTRRILQGKYDTRVRVARRDELGALSESFNEMASGLEQRERYRGILVQVTDADVARRLIESPSLGGERREVSVLFCDIRGFTAVTDGMAPEEVIAMLNEHMSALTACVHRHHGVVDKFVGDLIMAVFGAPESNGDDAGNAARCALEMVETRRRLNAVTEYPPLEIGIGVASGPAVAGCMGSTNRLNYTVLGERVNLAARLCSAAGPGEVLIDPATAERLDRRAAGELLEEKRFKGFRRAVRPFRLKGLAPEPLPAPA